MRGRKRNRFSRKGDPSLIKIIFVLILLCAAAFGGVRAVQWFNNDFVGGRVEAAASTDLDRARELLERGATGEAREVLEPIIARVDDAAVTPKALMLQANLERQEGNLEAAVAHLRKAAEDYPNSSDQPIAAIAYARLLEETGQLAEAEAAYAKVKETAPPELRAPAIAGLARAKERGDHLIEARELYRQAANEAAWNSEEWQEAVDGLGRTNIALIFSPKPTEQSKVYRVEPGDSLTSIGMKLNTTQGQLMRANNMDNPNRLQLGQALKYTPKDFRIVIERSTCRLFLLDGEGIFKVYKVGLGKEGRTTLGRYKIGNKEVDPTWFKPGSEPIPSGDPRNELGTRWMPLVPEADNLPNDLGIHGTIAPDTIGKYASMGCPRLLNEEVEELYDLVVRATPVLIVETYQPELRA